MPDEVYNDWLMDRGFVWDGSDFKFIFELSIDHGSGGIESSIDVFVLGNGAHHGYENFFVVNDYITVDFISGCGGFIYQND